MALTEKYVALKAAQPEQEPEVYMRARWPMNKWKENKPPPTTAHMGWADG